MAEIFRVRVERPLLRKISKVAKENGTTPGEVVRMLFKQMAKRSTIPFPLQADVPEEEILSSWERRNAVADEFSGRYCAFCQASLRDASRFGTANPWAKAHGYRHCAAARRAIAEQFSRDF